MRVLVCGGRDYKDKDFVFDVLAEQHDILGRIDVIIQGGARGADTFAAQWAASRAVPNWEFKADWERYGRGAGAVRNGIMLKDGKPQLVIAFPGGNGTQDMVVRAKKAGLPVVDYRRKL